MENTSPLRLSAAVAGFLEPLAVREATIFGELRNFFPRGAGGLDEQEVRYRLADHAVRVCAAQALAHANSPSQSQRLRELPAIVDRATALAAAQAVRAANGLESAALAAQEAPIAAASVNDPGFVGEQAAYSVLALADFYLEPAERHQVLEDAAALITSLSTAATHG